MVVRSRIQSDGDAVGSTAALVRAMRRIGKKCLAIGPSHIPWGLDFIVSGKD